MINEANGLPNGWVQTRIQDLYDIVGGGTPSTKVSGYWEGNIPWITSADIFGAKDIRPKRAISKKAVEKSATSLVPANSLIVVTRVGLGKVALAPTALCFSQDSQALVANHDLVNPDYALYYLTKAVQVFRYENRGTTIAGVTKRQLAELSFPLPPLPEQQRIVAKIEELFTKLDAGVAALKIARMQLGRYRQAILKAAVTGELTRGWREVHRSELELAADLLACILTERRAKWEEDQRAKMQAAGKSPKNDEWKQKYQDPSPPDTSELPLLPEGWIWARAEQLCDFITKGTTPAAHKLFSGSGEIPFIKVYNLTHVGLLDFTISPTFISHATHTGDLARSKVIPGDVLMNIVGPPLGKVSIVPDTYEEWNMNQAVAVFRPMPSFDRKYLTTCLLTREIQSWAERRAKATAGQFNLTLEICRDLPLPLPSLVEQQQIVLEVERSLSIADAIEQTIEQSLKQAERLRQSILQQAFVGKLVPQDPNDEPASILLERIREEQASESPSVPKQKRKSSKQKQPAQTAFFS